MKKIFWVFSVILGIIILIMILLPGFARKYAVSHSKELLGRQIALEKLSINYFTTTVRLIDFKMYEADGKETFASFDTLLVDLQPLNLIRNELVIEQFYLGGLYAKVIRKDSTFNFDDLVAFHTAKDSTEAEVADTTPSKPLRFRFSNIELSNANFVLDDQNVGKTTNVRDLSFFIPLIAWNQAQKSEAGLRFDFAKEGFFESSIKIDPIAGDFDADVTINSLYLNIFTNYAKSYANIDSLDGKFNSDLHITGNINKIEEAVVSGKIDIQDFMMTDLEGRKFLGMKRLEVNLKKIDPYYSRYEIDSVILTGPYLHFILSDSTDNISEIFAVSDTVKEAPKPAETIYDTSRSKTEDSLYYTVNSFIIRQGMVDYTDNLTGEPFDYHLSEIVLNTDSISSDAGWVNLYSQMLLNERGSLKAEVGFNPLDPVHNITLNYVITDFQLSDLNIYSRFYMGFPIIYGNMYYKSETSIIQGQLESENKLVMTEVEMGDKSGGIYDLPIKFALFILKDREGVINLDVPVRGDLNDPKIRIWKLVWTTFKNLIIKLAAAPFDALAGVVKADPKELQSIEFDYMDTTLTAQRQHQLDLLLELEQKKEGLGIELVYFNDVDKEKALIAEAKNLDDAEKIEKQSGLFAASRVHILENYLHAVNDSTFIRISASDPRDPKNVGSMPVFEVIYSISSQTGK
jgi:hypothetical protein